MSLADQIFPKVPAPHKTASRPRLYYVHPRTVRLCCVQYTNIPRKEHRMCLFERPSD